MKWNNKMFSITVNIDMDIDTRQHLLMKMRVSSGSQNRFLLLYVYSTMDAMFYMDIISLKLMESATALKFLEQSKWEDVSYELVSIISGTGGAVWA
jgi:hypothetical protein